MAVPFMLAAQETPPPEGAGGGPASATAPPEVALYLSGDEATPAARRLEKPPRSPDRLIVRFRGDVEEESVRVPPGLGRVLRMGAGRGLFRVELPQGTPVEEALRRYQERPDVLYAEPDYLVTTTVEPTDPLWTQQWDMRRIAAPTAWTLGTSASDVIVAVLDTGIDFSHPDLRDNLWTGPDGSHGFTCLSGRCAPGGADDHGHGTHVAGTIGAVAGNGIGIAGVNWHAQILACKFMNAGGSGSVSDAILCYQKILELKRQGHNIRVVNNSWGGGGFSQALKEVMEAVEAEGIVNVCSAGNNGANADLSPMYPAGYDNAGIVSVLASDASDAAPSFTNYGMASVDIAAPGVATVSTVPAAGCTLCDPSGFRVLSGTSMAAPHVSAVLAALFHFHPQLSAYEARDILLDPDSYDPVADPKAAMSTTGGRLNFYRVVTNPRIAAPRLNRPPAVTGVQNAVASGGQGLTLSAAAEDPDGDPLRQTWARGSFNAAPGAASLWLMGSMLGRIFPAAGSAPPSFQAPALARAAVGTYAYSVSDGRGGGASAAVHAGILPASGAGRPPSASLSVSPLSGPVGTTLTVSFPAADPEGGPVAWELWQMGAGGGFGWCCQTGATFNLPVNQAGVYRISAQAVDGELNFSERQSVVVRIGGATGTPPVAAVSLDRTYGTAPLAVAVDMSASTDPDGSIREFIIECNRGASGTYQSGPRATCQYDRPGNYWIFAMAKDNDGLVDAVSAYVSVLPATAPPTKRAARVTLGALTQTYSGKPLTPTATTDPPGLPVTWINAPQTNAGQYAVTATVTHPDYEGAATATFTIRKAAATVTLGALTQSYTGSPLSPTAATTPAGLAIRWTNAPQTAPGTYTVRADVADPNYEGSASGTFTILQAEQPVPPQIAITSPAPGPVPAGPLTIQTAVKPGTRPIAKVEVLVNGTVRCTLTAAPYSCVWNMPAAQKKTYQIDATVYDAGGLTGKAAPVIVTR
jgi:subtilisin family serine protease